MWPQDPGAPTRHRADRAAFCSACFALSGAHEALACVALTAPAAGHRPAPRPPGRPGAAPGQPRAPPPQPARPPPRGPAQQRRCRRARSRSSAGRGARDPPPPPAVARCMLGAVVPGPQQCTLGAVVPGAPSCCGGPAVGGCGRRAPGLQSAERKWSQAFFTCRSLRAALGPGRSQGPSAPGAGQARTAGSPVGRNEPRIREKQKESENKRTRAEQRKACPPAVSTRVRG